MPYTPRPIGCRPVLVRPPRVRPLWELDGLADVAALISILGGNASVPAFYDVRAGVTGTTTVSQWDDARGASGFAPSLAQATASKQPLWDAAAQTITPDGTDDFLETAVSSLFDLSGAYSLVVVGAFLQSVGTVFPCGVADGGAGATRQLTIRQSGTAAGTLLSQITGGGASITANSAVVVSTTRRLCIVSKNGTTGTSIDVPDVARVNGTNAGSVASGNNALTVGGAMGGVSVASLVCRAVLCLTRQVTAADIATLRAWTVANHGAVAA